MLQLVIYLFNYFIFSFKGSVVWLKSLLCLASLQILSGTKWMEAVSVDRHTIKPKAKGIVIRPPLPLGPCFAVSSFSPFLPSFPPLPRLLSFSYSPLLLPYSSCSFNIHYITILFFISIDNPPPTVSRLNSQPFHTILIIRMNVNIR